MAIVKAKCPNCNELIEIEASDFNVVCKYCGVPFMPKEGIENYNKHISILAQSINIDTIDVNAESVSNYATLGLAALKDKNHEKCGFYADDILKRNPYSPEGLLLKAFFVSNNYSKEDGIRYYLQAYENAKDNKLITVIIDTMRDEFEDYADENFIYLLQEIIKYDSEVMKSFYLEALNYVSSSFQGNPLIEKLNIDFDTLFTYLEISPRICFSQYGIDFYFEMNCLFFVKGKCIYRVVKLDNISKEIEKFFNKKDSKKITYNFYVGSRIIDLKIDEAIEDLEKLLNDNSFTIVPIKGGCYIATCVYGSYNAPEVWALRRYRDQCLAKNIFGRLFIKIYYAISPTIVKIFKNNQLFHRFNKKILDAKVKKLISNGISDLPYRDNK